jgi:hypothetical protein
LKQANAVGVAGGNSPFGRVMNRWGAGRGGASARHLQQHQYWKDHQKQILNESEI